MSYACAYGFFCSKIPTLFALQSSSLAWGRNHRLADFLALLAVSESVCLKADSSPNYCDWFLVPVPGCGGASSRFVKRDWPG